MKFSIAVHSCWLIVANYILLVSSEGALYVMMTYDIDIQDTPVLNNNFEHLCHDDFGD